MPIERSAGRRHEQNTVPDAGGNPPTQAPRGFLTGAAARARSEQVMQQQNEVVERRAQGLDLNAVNATRFRLPNDGDEADIIILDATLDNVLFADEHQMKGPDGRFNVFEFCPKQHDHCPLCEDRSVGNSSYTMYLTILDLRGRTDSRTQVFIPHEKRLMAVRSNLHPQFFKLHDACVREHGTMRGMQLLMARDPSLNSAIGQPVMLPSGKMFNWIDEATLEAEFGHEEIRDADRGNALVKAKNFDITPCAYTRVFIPATGEDLRNRYGSGSAPAGSRHDIQQEWQGAEHRANQGETRVRTRSRMQAQDAGGAGMDPIPETRSSPPASLPPRTRSRSAMGSGPVQPGGNGAPPPRTRSRTAAPTTVSRSQGGVPTDLDDANVPI